MGCFFAKTTRHPMGRIRTLALIIIMVFGFGSTAAFARGGGHSGGGHGGGHSSVHGGHSGGHRGHPGGHNSGKHGRITGGTTTRGDFMNRRCAYTDRTWADCPELTEKQWQAIPAEKAGNSFESRFE
jgi:hypothetical protein